MDRVTSALWQFRLGIVQCASFIVLSLAIWQATHAAANANKRMADLSRETAEEDKAREIRDLKAEIVLAIETYKTIIKWLNDTREVDLDNKDYILPFPKYICNIENMPSKVLDHEQLAKIKKAKYSYDILIEKINSFIIEQENQTVTGLSLQERAYKAIGVAVLSRIIKNEMNEYEQSLKELVSMVVDIQATL